jgi:ribosomal protein S17E
MGRIKTTLIKRTTRKILEGSPESFGKDFDQNKKPLGKILPSKRMRNSVAGYITRLKKNTKTIIENTED